MGCESTGKGGGFAVSAMRSSMERRRVSNAKVTSQRQRKYQELTTRMEQENLQRAKAILERRKSERDRLNAYIRSEHFMKGMRRPITEGSQPGAFARPPWTASLRGDYETLIRLREKEIAVATLRIKRPTPSGLHAHARAPPAEPRPLNKGFGKCLEFQHDALEPEFGKKYFDSNYKSNASIEKNNLKVMENKLLVDIDTNLLALEPTMFRDHSLNGLKSCAKGLPPITPTSNPRVLTSSLKSCLKSNKDNHESSRPLSKTPRSYLQELGGTFQSRTITTQKMGTILNGPQSLRKTMTHSTIKTMMTYIPDLEMAFSANHEDTNNVNESKEQPHLQPPNDIKISKKMFLMPTIPNGALLKDKAVTTIHHGNKLPNFVNLRSMPSHQMDNKVPKMLSSSCINKWVQDNQSDNPNYSSSPSYVVQQISESSSTLSPRYTSIIESWQEDVNCEPSILEECPTSPILSSLDSKHGDKTYKFEEEMFTSLDSEAATTRLIAEVISVQSRLEDCKLKPLDFKNILANPSQYPNGGCSHLEQCIGIVPMSLTLAKDASLKPLSTKEQDPNGGCSHLEQCIGIVPMSLTLTKDASVKPSSTKEQDPKSLCHQKKQGAIEVTMQNHEIFIHDDTSEEVTIASILEEEAATTKNASKFVGASSIDEYKKELLTTTNCCTNRIDNFIEMPSSKEMESRKPMQEESWVIPWRNERGLQKRPIDLIANVGCQAMESEGTLSNSTVPVSLLSYTIVKPPKPIESILSMDNHLEKMKQLKGSIDQQPQSRHVLLQTNIDLKQYEKNSTNQIDLHASSYGRSENIEVGSECSSTSTKRTSKYMNSGYRDLSEAPRPKYKKQHCFLSSHGLLQIGYSQPRQSPKRAKQNLLDIKLGHLDGFLDSQHDKENYGISSSDDQELSILASLERLDWKLAAISTRAVNQASITPSIVSQNQNSVQSAPAATKVKPTSNDGTPRDFHLHPLRPSSVKTQKPPIRNFRQRRIVGVTNKFHQDIYN